MHGGLLTSLKITLLNERGSGWGGKVPRSHLPALLLLCALSRWRSAPTRRTSVASWSGRPAPSARARDARTRRRHGRWSVDGDEDDHPDRFITGPAIGVRSLAHHVHCALRAMRDHARCVLARVSVCRRCGHPQRRVVAHPLGLELQPSFKKSNVW